LKASLDHKKPYTNTKLESLVCSGQYPLPDFMICQHILYGAVN